MEMAMVKVRRLSAFERRLREYWDSVGDGTEFTHHKVMDIFFEERFDDLKAEFLAEDDGDGACKYVELLARWMYEKRLVRREWSCEDVAECMRQFDRMIDEEGVMI